MATQVRDLRIRPDVSLHELDDQLVIFDPKSGQAHFMNPTASYLCGLLDGSRTTSELARSLSAAYDVPYGAALADVRMALNCLNDANLLAGERQSERHG